MVSGFVSRDFGVGLLLNEEQLNKVNERRVGQEWCHYLSADEAMTVYGTTKKKKITDPLTLTDDIFLFGLDYFIELFTYFSRENFPKFYLQLINFSTALAIFQMILEVLMNPVQNTNNKMFVCFPKDICSVISNLLKYYLHQNVIHKEMQFF